MIQPKKLLHHLLTSIDMNEAVALVTVIQADGDYLPALGQRMLVWLNKPSYGELKAGNLEQSILDETRHCLLNRKPQQLHYQNIHGTMTLFVEIQRRKPTLLIVGAGHIALPMAQLGKLLDFEVVVLDDRPKYANKQRFPMADHVLAQPFQQTLQQWPINNDTYIILVTRGHSHDVSALLELLDSPAHYIGMIGSKRRVKAVFDLLTREKGIDPAKFEKVYAPIGLDIGAESPAEIAIAIAAEIINLYRGGRATSLAQVLRADYRLTVHPQRKQ